MTKRLLRKVGDYPRIIAFRNVLIHGYDIIEQHLSKLRKDVMKILKD